MVIIMVSPTNIIINNNIIIIIINYSSYHVMKMTMLSILHVILLNSQTSLKLGTILPVSKVKRPQLRLSNQLA